MELPLEQATPKFHDKIPGQWWINENLNIRDIKYCKHCTSGGHAKSEELEGLRLEDILVTTRAPNLLRTLPTIMDYANSAIKSIQLPVALVRQCQDFIIGNRQRYLVNFHHWAQFCATNSFEKCSGEIKANKLGLIKQCPEHSVRIILNTICQ